MKGFLMLNGERLGEVDFKILDESMGAIGGQLSPFPAYEMYEEQIQLLTESRGIANTEDFEFKITLGDVMVKNVLGGIGVTHLRELDEIEVEAAGLDPETIILIKESI